MNKIIIAPSILSADFANLEQEIKRIEIAGADWVHVDVMDGNFVPNITIGAPVVKNIRRVTKLPLDVHLMINHPEKYIKDFIKSGADYITVHYEACKDNLNEILESIRALGAKAGLSIKPATPVEAIEKYITKLDLILIMSVEPGFGGQSFMYESLEKISKTRAILNKYELSKTYLEVDGGINSDTAKLSIAAGANALVAGSYVYGADDIKQAIESLR